MFIVCFSFNVQRVFSLSSYVLSHFLSKARTENGNHGETLETSSTLSLSHFINISSLLSFLFSENAETIYIFIFSLFSQNFTRTELQTHREKVEKNWRTQMQLRDVRGVWRIEEHFLYSQTIVSGSFLFKFSSLQPNTLSLFIIIFVGQKRNWKRGSLELEPEIIER